MSDTVALMKQIENDAMVTWTDERRKDFVGTFSKRTRVSQYLLTRTAEVIIKCALSKHFISQKHVNKLNYNGFRSNASAFFDKSSNYNGTVAGRTAAELDELAEIKAKEILSGLPPLKKAISIIDPETSQMIINKEKLEASGQKYLDQLDEISGDLDLSDLDQSMTLCELRALVKKRDKRRRVLVAKLNEIGEELAGLDKTISKRLYAGIPGLSDAVVHAINACKEKTTAIGEVSRRIEEKVMFGDSEAALEILQSFEQDELEVSDEIRAEFKQAMEKLKLTGRKTKSNNKGKCPVKTAPKKIAGKKNV